MFPLFNNLIIYYIKENTKTIYKYCSVENCLEERFDFCTLCPTHHIKYRDICNNNVEILKERIYEDIYKIIEDYNDNIILPSYKPCCEECSIKEVRFFYD